MDFLLDTHGLIWFINGDEQLSEKAKELIKNIDNKSYISIATVWEIAIKSSLNKLDLNGGFDEIGKIITKYEFELLPICMEHVAEIITLDFHHRDPFDRLLIAQSIVENIPIVTKDRHFAAYKIDTIWD